MERRHDIDPLVAAKRPPESPDGRCLSQECVAGDSPEGHDDPGVHGPYLGPQVPDACLDLVGFGVPVVGRPALHHVCDVHILPPKTHGAYDPREKLPRRADERPAGIVLHGAGALADEHQRGMRVPLAEDDVLSRQGEPACGTGPDRLDKIIQIHGVTGRRRVTNRHEEGPRPVRLFLQEIQNALLHNRSFTRSRIRWASTSFSICSKSYMTPSGDRMTPLFVSDAKPVCGSPTRLATIMSSPLRTILSCA